MPKLNELNIQENQISSLNELKDLPGLKQIFLNKNPIEEFSQ